MAPRDRDDPESRRRAEQRRNEQTNPEAGGRPLGYTGRGAIPVRIVSASSDFFDRMGQPAGADGQRRDPGHGFRSVIRDQRAMAQSVRQVTDELRKAVDMAQQYQINARREMDVAAEFQRRSNDEQREHVRRVLDSIEQSLTRMERREEQAERRGRVPEEEARRPAPPTRPLRDLDDIARGGTGGGPPGPPRGGGGGRGSGEDDEEPRGRRRPSGSPLQGPMPEADEYGPALPPDMAAARAAAAREQASRDAARTVLRNRPIPPQARSRAGLQRELRGRLAEELHQRYGEGTERNGTLLPQYDENGDLSHHVIRRAGQEDEIVENDDPRLPGLLRRGARMAAVSTASRGLAAAGFAGAARAVPYVGWALTAADVAGDVGDWIADQNKKSTYYQGIYGGDSKLGADALGQRIQEEAYVFGTRYSSGFTGGLTGDDARQAFKGVSQIGLKDAERSTALEFVERSYKDLGMDVQSSLSLIEMSAKGANVQLAGLDTALKGVSTMAKATGQNANVLYQAFAQNYQLALGMSAGPSAPALAATFTAMSAGQGRSLAGMDYSPLATETSQRMVAQYSGHSYTWLQGQLAMGNTLPYTEAVDRRNNVVYQTVANSQPGVYKVMQDEIAAAGGPDKITEGKRAEIAAKMMTAPGADVENVRRLLQAQGVENVQNMNGQQVYEAWVNHAVGGDNATKNMQMYQDKFNEGALAKGDDPTTTRGEGFLWLTRVQGSNWVRDRVSTDPGVVAFGWGERGNKNQALEAYTKRQQGVFGDSGKDKSSPVMESLIDKFGKDSNVGIKVQTGDGEKVVSLSEAIQYYPDQVNKGTASIVGGDPANDGKSVKEVVGGASQTSTDADTTGAKGTPGVSADDWKKDHPTDATQAQDAQGGGKITLDMSDDLRRWFSANVSGSVTDPSTEAGASGAVPPASSGGLPR